MKFSIVIPSFQQAEFLRATLESVLTQGYPECEIIVRDGGSKDGSVEILRELGRDGAFRWVSELDGGQAAAINLGLRESTGEIHAYLNSDDIYLPDTLRRVAEYFTANPNCLVLYGNADHLNRDGSFMERYPVEPWDYRRLQTVCFLCQPAVFWRREVEERFGVFDPDLHFSMDYDYWLRVGKQIKFHHLGGAALAGSRLHSDTKTMSQRLPAHQEYLQVVMRHGGERPAVLKWLRNVAELQLAAVTPRPATRFRRASTYVKFLFAAAWKFAVPPRADLFTEAKAALLKRRM